MNEISLIEEISMNAHPSLKTIVYDGWILRFANGHTNRANSINLTYPGKLPLEEKISECERIYESQGLPTIYKLTVLSAPRLDSVLEAKGYKVVTPTNIMTKTLNNYQTLDRQAVITHKISKEWQECYFDVNHIDDSFIRETDRQIQGNIINHAICASIFEDGRPVACGLCVIEREYVGLYNITVHEDYRKKGLGFTICSSLLNEAKRMGAKKAYLQVVDGNTLAIKLYHKLGFEDCYQYWYRVKDNK